MTTTRIMAAAALIVGGALAPHVAPAQQPGTRRTELQRHDLGVPGREVIQVRVELDPGVAFGEHWHPGEEIVYVLEGSLEYRVEGKPPVTLEAGDVLFIPAGTIHAVTNVGRGNGAELATYDFLTREATITPQHTTHPNHVPPTPPPPCPLSQTVWNAVCRSTLRPGTQGEKGRGLRAPAGDTRMRRQYAMAPSELAHAARVTTSSEHCVGSSRGQPAAFGDPHQRRYLPADVGCRSSERRGREGDRETNHSRWSPRFGGDPAVACALQQQRSRARAPGPKCDPRGRRAVGE